MGIKGLTKEIKKFAPSAIQTMTYKELEKNSKRKVYGVDVFSYLYPTQYNVGKKSKGNHIREFMEMITTWSSYGIKLIFVLDGNTNSEAKRDTINDRADKRIKGQANVQRLIHEIMETDGMDDVAEDNGILVINTDLNKCGHTILASSKGTAEQRIELENALRSHIIVSGDKINDLITLFQLVGATYMQANGEADFLLSSLYKNGYIDGVISEDSDMLTHGIDRLVRGINDPGLRRDSKVTVYCLSDILDEAKLSMNQFIDYCILCGCDYCPKINKIGGVTALKLLRTHSNIDNIVISIKQGTIKYKPCNNITPDDYLFKYERAFGIFSREQENLPPFELGDYCVSDGFIDWILSETNYTKSTLDNKIKILDEHISKKQEIIIEVPNKCKPEVKVKKAVKIKIKPKLKHSS